MSEERVRQTAMNVLSGFLRAHGMRNTSERWMILDRVLSMPGHFTVEDLCATLDDDAVRISRATVYNTVAMFVKAGILRQNTFDGFRSTYERGLNVVAYNHVHLVCTTCGKVKDVRDVEVMRQLTTRHFTAFTPQQVTVNIYGLCSRCQRKMKNQQTG